MVSYHEVSNKKFNKKYGLSLVFIFEGIVLGFLFFIFDFRKQITELKQMENKK